MSTDIKIAHTLQRIKELQDLVVLFIKPVPSDSQYVERHFEYMKLEDELDYQVKRYFELTGKGRLDTNGKYF